MQFNIVKEKHPLTTLVNGCFLVERKGAEPSTFALRTRRTTDTSSNVQALTTTPSPACSAPCSEVAETAHDEAAGDPQLAAVVKAWPTLPEPIRRAIVAMIGAASY